MFSKMKYRFKKETAIMKEEKANVENGNGKYVIPNLQNALQLVEKLTEYPEGLTLPEMVQVLGVPKTTLFRITNTLLMENFLLKDYESNRFSLSRKFLRIGLAAIGEQSLIEKALIPMRDLRDEIHETVLLGSLMDIEGVLLEQVIGNHPFTFYLNPGKRFKLHCSAPGKVMLAYLEKSQCERILDEIEYIRYNDNTITTKEEMLAELEVVKEKGYGIDCAEEVEGVHCIGAPIFDQNGTVIAAIWTTGPAGRIPKSNFDSVGEKIKACANRVSRSFGYQM
ncbi:IclR family transcriptional regulator [Prolixibacteraceae bacterium JC049]|jgi:DNA-binding IclR family transcriptional regulator|nr:IclR family transcriptional regulator [Prolixibacteraceae bacterium JC049]